MEDSYLYEDGTDTWSQEENRYTAGVAPQPWANVPEGGESHQQPPQFQVSGPSYLEVRQTYQPNNGFETGMTYPDGSRPTIPSVLGNDVEEEYEDTMLASYASEAMVTQQTVAREGHGGPYVYV